MKRFYKFIIFIGIGLWIAETGYFGWNDKAQTTLEKLLDFISMFLIIWGILGDIASNLTINKTNNFYPKNVNIKNATIKNK